MTSRHPIAVLSALLVVTACDHAVTPTAVMEKGAQTIAAAPSRFKAFAVPSNNSQPRHLALALDGNMWFTESRLDAAKIAFVPAKGKITEFVVPNAGSQPDDIVLGPDDALWFTGPSGFPDFFIGRVTTSGVFTGFAPACDPQGGCSIVPQGIASGSDGNLWFTENIRNAVVRLTPSGTFTFFTIPTGGANPHGITTGPDGALWFAEFNGNKIGRIDSATGAITEFGPVSGSPHRIATGPDGNLWFTEPFPFDNRVGRITPAGVITEFAVASGAQPQDIEAGVDGNLYFTENGANQLGRITVSGVVTEVQTVRGGPWGIGRGTDRDLWITQIDGNRIARFTLAPAP